MKKDIKEKITVNGIKICRVTTPDERFYGREEKNSKTGLPEINWAPSVTWIKSYWYKSPFLIKWIAEKGLTESEAIKKEAGLKGDKIHQATEDIDKGLKIKIDDKYLNKENGEEEELTAEEIEAIKSYADFIDNAKPELLANEMTVFNKPDLEEKFAGTLDRIFGIVKKGVRQIWIIDIKTSKSIYKDMILQLSAYSHSDIDYAKMGITDKEWKNRKLAILQVGYSRNKSGYKFTEVDDRYDLFQLAYGIWKEENPNTKPKQRDYPLELFSKFRQKKEEKIKKKGTKK